MVLLQTGKIEDSLLLMRISLSIHQTLQNIFSRRLGFGIAPYIGDYGDLHTWVMLQIQHTPKLETEEINVTPLLRFFKNVYLVESGVSLDGEIILMLLFVLTLKEKIMRRYI